MEIIEGKRQLQQQQSTKSSRSPSPQPAGEVSPSNGDYRSLIRTPPPSRAGPPPSPPVPTHPIAPVAPEPSGPQPLMPCQVCGRTFLPQSLSKHVKICEKNAVKKRKTFDSSRQRREGTDLEQYLPKNFGLPENSPFLEKSPPPTAKPTPKPKVQAVRNAITKPIAELQKCPHCNRAFGVRAFERHVEWCADKAKILPTAPTQPPQHIADAKQRLNARTQYKAPPVRGRRSSQTRDKSSNSRSASVESSRGVSPPREFGDYRHGRTRASESASSNDCHDDVSPHIPVIRHSRNSQNSSGDANVKARQARLARDLSNSRLEESQPPPQPSNQSNPKRKPQPKPKTRLDVKKQQQLKKLEELANKYKDKNEKEIKELKDNKKEIKRDKSSIPVPKQKVVHKVVDATHNKPDVTKYEPHENANMIGNAKSSRYKQNLAPSATPRKETPRKEVKNDPSDKNKKSKCKEKEIKRNLKESTMSLDSLDEPIPKTSKNCQSIGIHTELLCAPCVIYETADILPKKKTKIKAKVTKDKSSDPEIELLYKNPTIVSSCDIRIQEYSETTESVNISTSKNSFNTPSISDNFTLDSVDSTNSTIKAENKVELIDSITDFVNEKFNDYSSCCHLKSDDANILTDYFDENDEQNISNEIYDDDNKLDNNINCHFGSGNTYTKFTEDPADLEEFINITDKLLINHAYNANQQEIEADVDNLHTPRTNSIEAIEVNNDFFEDVKEPDTTFSNTFEELKSYFKELLGNAGRKEVIKKTEELVDDTDIKKVENMEHITIYKLNEEKPVQQDKSSKGIQQDCEFKLPSIKESNRSQGKSKSAKKDINIYKSTRKYKLLAEEERKSRTFISDLKKTEDSDTQSVSSEAPPLKLPRIENKKERLDDTYDPFVSAARQMKELMSSETNIPKLSSSSKDLNRTLPILRNTKEKASTLNSHNTKMMKDTLNKSYQKTPTLQRMKSFGSTNNDTNSFGGRCSSFRMNRNDKKYSQNNDKKSSQKLNSTFTKSSKENISTVDKNYFNRNSNLNRSFSSYTASSYSTPKPKDKIPKIANSMYHSFQRTTIKQPVKLDKIKRDEEKKDFVSLDAILADDNSSMTDSNYIDPRLINENDNLPINVNTILNNPDIISSMESLLTTENLPSKFESFSSSNLNNNIKNRNGITNSSHKLNKIENNNNNKLSAPTIDNLSNKYDKIMSSLEQSITSKTSVRDDESLCGDFDLEYFMTTFDEEVIKHKLENKRTCSSTTRVVKQSELVDSNKTSELNSVSSSPKIPNGMIPVNKSMSLTFSHNNMVNENLFPSSVKRSTSLLDSIQKKSAQKVDSTKNRQKVDQLEQDLMQSLKDFDKLYASEKTESVYSAKETTTTKYNATAHNGTAKRAVRGKPERKTKEDVSNGNYTPNGKPSNDSAYSSLNRISPSKLSLCATKEPNGPASLDQNIVGSDSGSHKDEIRSISSEEFLAMERSAELDAPLPPLEKNPSFKDIESLSEKRVNSRPASRRSSTWRVHGELSSSGSEASLHPRRDSAPLPRLSRFCHECGTRFSVDTAKFCIECGVRRLLI